MVGCLIIGKFKDIGTFIVGEVESGSIHEADSLILKPNIQTRFFPLSFYRFIFSREILFFLVN